MKVNFELKPVHKQILQIIYETTSEGLGEDRSISYYDLEKIINALSETDFSIGHDEFARLMMGTSHFQRSPLFFEKRNTNDLETQIEDLLFLDFITYGLHPKYDTKIPWLDDDLKDSSFSLSEQGIRVAKADRVERRILLRPRKPQQIKVFIASAFGFEEIDALYETQFEPAIHGLGYEPLRIDLSEPTSSITEAILEGIKEARCVIADLTHARPSVYFEVGFALGLGVPILLTCRKDHYRGIKTELRVHFDLEQYRTSFWERDPDMNFSWEENMSVSERLPALLK